VSIIGFGVAEVKRRPYRSEIRADKARQTRRRIIEAATRLFVERGYAATSIADVGAAAGVTGRTVHLDFANKRALLDAAIGVALAGDDDPTWVRERDWFRATLEAPGNEIPRLFATFTTALHVRSAALLEAAEAAASADPELAVRRDRGHQNRRADMRRVADALATKTGIDADYATDALYTLGSSAVYALLVFQLGWTPETFETWLSAMLSAALFGPPAQAVGVTET
jgi:AcrR family transcriptional regulator